MVPTGDNAVIGQTKYAISRRPLFNGFHPRFGALFVAPSRMACSEPNSILSILYLVNIGSHRGQRGNLIGQTKCAISRCAPFNGFHRLHISRDLLYRKQWFPRGKTRELDWLDKVCYPGPFFTTPFEPCQKMLM